MYLQQLQAIHGLKAELCLDDADYRALLERVAGSRSAKYMTPEQRERVIALLRLHLDLDAAIAQLEAARAALAEAPAFQAEAALPKVVVVGGVRRARMRATVEQVMAVVRQHHGPDVRLTGAGEVVERGAPALELRFERAVAAEGAEAEDEATPEGDAPPEPLPRAA